MGGPISFHKGLFLKCRVPLNSARNINGEGGAFVVGNFFFVYIALKVGTNIKI